MASTVAGLILTMSRANKHCIGVFYNIFLGARLVLISVWHDLCLGDRGYTQTGVFQYASVGFWRFVSCNPEMGIE